MIAPKMAICHPNNIGSVNSEFGPTNFSLLKDFEYKWRFLPEDQFSPEFLSLKSSLVLRLIGRERRGRAWGRGSPES